MEDFIKLENSIKRGLLGNIYLIYGEQDYLKDLAVKRIKDYILQEESQDFNFDVLSEPLNFYQLVNSAEQLPVFAEKRMVVAKSQNLFNDSGELGEDELLTYLNNPNPSTCLVFVATTIDLRRKTVKLIKEKGEILHLANPKNNQLVGWIQKQVQAKGKKIEQQAIELLITAVGDNLLLLEQEIEKVDLFSADEYTRLAHVEQTVSITASLNVFKITDLVAEKKAAAAVKLFTEMVVVGEHPIKILALLGRTFRQMLRAKLLATQSHLNNEQLSRELKVPGFVAKKLISQQRWFSEEQLYEALNKTKDADWKIKTGQVDPIIAVELVIYHLAGQSKKELVF